MRSFGVLWVVLVGVVGAAERPDVLFLIADDLSAEALGCYGNAQVRTPHLDALAARGMKWTRAYCQYPVCGPSRAALMSGLYPQQNGVTGNGSSDRLAAALGRRPTLPEYFRRSGWHSVRVSKIYHMRVPGDITAGVDGPDHAASWSERFNCRAPEWMTEGEAENIGDTRLRFERDKHYNLGFGSAFYVIRGEGDGAVQADHLAAEKAVEVLKAERDGPLFLAVGFVRPHVPLVAPREFYDPYPAAEMTLPEAVEDDWADIPKAGRGRTFGIRDRPAEQRKVLAAYYASVSYMDAQVGKVLKALEDSGRAGNTVVVFTSDHGYHLGEHGFWQKMNLHEESVRVPLLLAGPGIPKGTSAGLAEAVDLYPTLAGLAGLAVPEHCAGVSLEPQLADPEAVVREDAYCLRSGAHLLRTGRWAYLRYPDGSEELYDMEEDPRQFTNIAANRREVVESLQVRLAARLAAMK